MQPDPTVPFGFAVETSKQIITLASGFLAISLTVLKEIVQRRPTPKALKGLLWAWIVLVLSILSGILMLCAIIGVAANAQELSVYAFGIRFFAFLQLVFFGLGIAALLFFGWHVLPHPFGDAKGSDGTPEISHSPAGTASIAVTPQPSKSPDGVADEQIDSLADRTQDKND